MISGMLVSLSWSGDVAELTFLTPNADELEVLCPGSYDGVAQTRSTWSIAGMIFGLLVILVAYIMEIGLMERSQKKSPRIDGHPDWIGIHEPLTMRPIIYKPCVTASH